jgi:hypothetical protein
MILATPAPFVSAFIEAVDEAIRQDHPNVGMTVMQRTWLAFCVTATLVTHSICWAQFERTSLGTYSMAAASWMFRHSKLPWDQLLVASVRVILRYHGIKVSPTSPRAAWSSTTPTTHAPNRLSSSPISINCVTKKAGATSGAKAWSFSY